MAGRLAGKGLSPQKVKETLSFCKELWKDKIIIAAGFIIGLPGEPAESIWETLNYLSDKNCPIDIFSYEPLILSSQSKIKNAPLTAKISKLERNPEKFGIKIVDESSEEWAGPTMAKGEAFALFHEINQHEKFRKMRIFAAFRWFGRAANIGYTTDDFLKCLKMMVPGLILKMST